MRVRLYVLPYLLHPQAVLAVQVHSSAVAAAAISSVAHTAQAQTKEPISRWMGFEATIERSSSDMIDPGSQGRAE